MDKLIQSIAAEMERRGVSQSELARLSEMPQQQVNLYLSGKKKPSSLQAARLMDALGDWQVKFTKRRRQAQ